MASPGFAAPIIAVLVLVVGRFPAGAGTGAGAAVTGGGFETSGATVVVVVSLSFFFQNFHPASVSSTRRHKETRITK